MSLKVTIAGGGGGGEADSEPGSIPGDSWFTGTGSDRQTGYCGGLGGGKGIGTAWPAWENACTRPEGCGKTQEGGSWPSGSVLWSRWMGTAGHPMVR